MPGKGKDEEQKPVKGTTEKVAKRDEKNPPESGKLLFCKNSAFLKRSSDRSHNPISLFLCTRLAELS